MTDGELLKSIEGLKDILYKRMGMNIYMVSQQLVEANDEDLYGWNAMQSMNTEDPQFANYMRQSWKGKADKDGNITHNVDWSKMVESITRKLNNKIKNYK